MTWCTALLVPKAGWRTEACAGLYLVTYQMMGQQLMAQSLVELVRLQPVRQCLWQIAVSMMPVLEEQVLVA